ncbi:hypothetical protein AEQU3_03262 [Aequorivita antarctica]|uniref:SH3 domain-containing protein n=2 Tax=Aequorivita antarctica TaxID=153266 RepID=A0A5C6YUG6_9FLAO|nr:SH3 domain-containing protein [Aequorivita antarctica]SRX76263.1 hypothetical protein AEQU3_03262 [Aequorivita antarctica]
MVIAYLQPYFFYTKRCKPFDQTKKHMKYIFTFAFLLFSFLTFSQNEFIVNTELLNVRSGAGTKYDVVGQVKRNEKVIEISKSGNWSEIKTDEFQGFVSSKYISSVNGKSDNEKEDSSIIGWLIAIGIIGFIIVKVKKFISGLFSGVSSGSAQRQSSSTRQSVRNTSNNSAVYRFRIKGSGSAGAVKYADGMNVEVAVNGLGSQGTPYNNIVEKLFVQEFARKYNIEPRFHSGIKMLFKRDRLDVEKL